MRRSRMSMLALFIVLTLLAQPAWAVQTIKTIKVGTTEIYKDGVLTTGYINTKQADITITTEVNLDRVDTTVGAAATVSDTTPTVTASTYTFNVDDYQFSKGSNSINVKAYSDSVLMHSVTASVYYYEIDEFYTNATAFTGSGKISAFDGGIKLVLGKGNYFKNVSNEATTSTTLNIAVEDRTNANFGSGQLSDYACVSPVYNIASDDPASVKLAKPVPITLVVDAGVPASQYTKLSVARSSDNFATVELMGGLTNSSGKTITTDPVLNLPGYSYAVVLYNNVITDAGWAEFSVTPLLAKGILDKDVIPTLSANTTRKNIAKMLVKGMGVPLLPSLPATPVFTDTITLAASERLYIETAAAYGIMRGVGGDLFSPDTAVTREQAAAILANVSALKLEEDETRATAAIAKLYKDYTAISAWSVPAVLAVTKAKLMVGIPVDASDIKQGYNFSGALNLDYKQSATIVYNLMKKKKRI